MVKPINIANSSSHNVYVQVTSDIPYKTAKGVEMGGNAVMLGGANLRVNNEKEWELPDKTGYTYVNRYSYMQFFPDAKKKICYVTIKLNHNDNLCICANHPLQLNHGIIITQDCYVRNAKKGQIWEDVNGENHDPANRGNLNDLPKNLHSTVVGVIGAGRLPNKSCSVL